MKQHKRLKFSTKKTDLQLRFVASTNNSVRLAVPFPPQGETVLRYCLRGRVLLHVGYTNDLVTSRKTNRTKIDLLWLSLVLPVYGMCKQNIVKKFGDKSEILISQENAHMPSISDSIPPSSSGDFTERMRPLCL